MNQKNKHKTGVPPLNCASHYDPGLFAFNFYSNCAGLQVQDQLTKEFVDVPFGVGRGIVWSGNAAHQTRNSIARGVSSFVSQFSLLYISVIVCVLCTDSSSCISG